MMSCPHVDVALVHAPVVNRQGEVIGSAVTNLDLHDIARACRTFGIDTYWVVTPYDSQRELSEQIISHWLEGHGKIANPDRGNALSLIRIRAELDEVIAETREKWGTEVLVVATCAGRQPETMAYPELRHKIAQGFPVLLLFGTGWGLAPEIFSRVNISLPPIQGTGNYNHLSVRSAASIILDRLLGNREDDA